MCDSEAIEIKRIPVNKINGNRIVSMKSFKQKNKFKLTHSRWNKYIIKMESQMNRMMKITTFQLLIRVFEYIIFHLFIYLWNAIGYSKVIIDF